MSFSFWRSSPLFVALVIIVLVGAMTPAAGQEATDQSAPDSAIADLGAAAAVTGLTEEELAELVASDPSLTVDGNGELLYLAPKPVSETDPESDADPDTTDGSDGPGDQAGDEVTPSPSVLETVQLDEDLTLASLPGARHTIVLDIDGHVTTGTSWNDGGDGPAIISGPFDLDGDRSSWSDAEREAVRTAWAIVAEDFAPWSVNVTTAEPEDPADLTHDGDGDHRWGVRVVLSPDDWMACGCAAAAYVGSFTDPTDEPAFVHLTDPALVGEAASHAVGHTLGLVNDGGDDSHRYPGHESLGGPTWAPIMGAPSGTAISHWSAQSYVGGDDNGQDDLAIIGSATSGIEARPDDHDDATAPTPLNGANPSVEGVITTSTDVDAFSFTTTGGPISLAVTGQPVGSNLDASLTLVDADGQEIVTDDPSEVLSASIETELPAGAYTAIVDGVGVGLPFLDPPTGYSDAGSLGHYTLSGTIVGAAPADLDPPAAPVGVIALAIEQLVVLGWAPTDDEDIDRYVVLRSGEPGGTGVEVATVSAELNGYEDLTPRAGDGFYTVVAVDDVGNRSAPSSEVQVTVEAAIGTFPDPDPQPELDPDPDPDPDPADEDADEADPEDGTETENDEADPEDGTETDPTEPQPDTEDGDEADEAEADEAEADEDTDTDEDTETAEDNEAGEDTEADEDSDDEDSEVQDGDPLVESEEEPERETFVYGAITGQVDAIAEADGRGQWVTETLSGGAERARHDRLEHRWVVPAATGNQQLHVVAEAGADAGDADDGFILAWSTDRIEWTTLATILPGETLDGSFDIGAPEGDVHVRVLDTDRTPRQQSPDSIFVDLIQVLGDGQEPEPDPEPTEVIAEIEHHFQGTGEGERAVVVTALVVDDLGQPVVGVSVEVEVMGDITETVTITTGGDGRGEEQTETAVLRPEIELCLADVVADGLTWYPGPDDCPTEASDEDEVGDTDTDTDTDTVTDPDEDEVPADAEPTEGDTTDESPADGDAEVEANAADTEDAEAEDTQTEGTEADDAEADDTEPADDAEPADDTEAETANTDTEVDEDEQELGGIQ